MELPKIEESVSSGETSTGFEATATTTCTEASCDVHAKAIFHNFVGDDGLLHLILVIQLWGHHDHGPLESKQSRMTLSRVKWCHPIRPCNQWHQKHLCSCTSGKQGGTQYSAGSPKFCQHRYENQGEDVDFDFLFSISYLTCIQESEHHCLLVWLLWFYLCYFTSNLVSVTFRCGKTLFSFMVKWAIEYH